MTHVPEGKIIHKTPAVYGVPAEYASAPSHEDRAPRRLSRVPRCPLRGHHPVTENVVCRPAHPSREFPEWMDLRTTQAYVSVSERTLRDWIHRERDPLPAFQDGGKIFISRSRLDRWMESHPITASSVGDVGAIVDEVMSSLAGGQ